MYIYVFRHKYNENGNKTHTSRLERWATGDKFVDQNCSSPRVDFLIILDVVNVIMMLNTIQVTLVSTIAIMPSIICF